MPARSVALVTLGCVRNEVDSEELAGRLAGAGWDLVQDPADADVAVVNTCGFIEQAKKDSVDVLLEVADLKGAPARGSGDGAGGRRRPRTRAVVAVGCMAERYGAELAEALPEADAVLGFDSYADLSTHLEGLLHGRAPAPHVPRDRRSLLPVSPAARQAAAGAVALPGHGPAGDLPAGAAPPSGPRVVRARLDGSPHAGGAPSPWAPLKLASGCDRRCTFCAIPSFRGAFVSRPPQDVLAEARWLAERGARELFLVSENSTSYGKDLGDLRALERLLPQLAAVDGVERVRVSYLQPAEVRPGLLEAIAGTPGVVPYFDLSFQHAAPGVLRRMRRFGGTEAFLGLLEHVRALAPDAGVRSNVIAGFPGEAEEDVAELERFLTAARLDVVGVFGYSDEEGTQAASLDAKVGEHEVAARVARLSRLVEELTGQRAEERVGSLVTVLVEEVEDGAAVGRAEHQGPDVDGTTRLLGPAAAHPVGALVPARVVAAEGVDLVAEPLEAGAGRPS
ncbi:MiaB/RimO family radical SAM methylthiotransferase [Quadrisphaera sp. DSM 44207]|uniref:MiaB/RimO family radical SAM methylthiotransferase n=1 Tax=Quadrisphaera sp. DSM 44207 TaxID=1881057 RepID=UPI000B86E6A8|nr:radical SAM protein [Quadrisphaera sp. DSM 44207]